MAKKIEDYTKEELLSYVKNLEKRKKFGLVWEEKPEDVATQCEVDLPVLEEVSGRHIKKDEDSLTHLMIEGDNYHSLSTLNYTHANAIDIIYIDPPYNTGSNDFIYNDRFVDKEDAFRHSKWLSFMSKRLKLAKQLLAEDGIIFMSIDDNEHAALKLLSDEIFGSEKFLGTITWEKRTKSQNTKTAKRMLQGKTEYVLVYQNSLDRREFKLEETGEKSYPENDTQGEYRYALVEEMSANGMRGRVTMVYPILGVKPRNGFQWKLGSDYIASMEAKNQVVLRNGRPYLIIRPDDEDSITYRPFWSHFLDKDLYGTAETGKSELKNIFGEDKGFETVKPVNLIKKMIFHASRHKDVTVLDFFAGSGTTGHAVLELNKEDGGRRQFILCTNNENGIAENITYERIKKVTEGYNGVDGIPANVRYFKTDFVSKKKTDDQTRLAVVDRCTDMIRIRENTFEEVINEDDFKLFNDTSHSTAIIFDPLKIAEFIKRIEDTGIEQPVHLYIFSYSSYAHDQDIPKTTLDYTTCSIPESVLEVYQRIFNPEGRSYV